MGGTFAEKFEAALTERKGIEPGFGLRTLARRLAKEDPAQTETIRRRLNKYRPKPGGGAAEVKPTAPTRWEIEDAMELARNALAPDAVDDQVAAVSSPLSRDEYALYGELTARIVAARQPEVTTAEVTA